MIIEKFTSVAPCEEACPAGIDVPRYIRAILRGDFDLALAVNLEKMPFPSVCGYICDAPCEKDCHMNIFGKPTAIRALKKLAAENGKLPEIKSYTGSTRKKIAIIGSGPAGLTAAYFLARKGHTLVVFEPLAKPGGVLRAFNTGRLPDTVLDKDISFIQSAGVEIRINSGINSAETFFAQGFNTVYIAADSDLTKADPHKMTTDKPGLFTGGELTSPIDSVIQAIAAGRRAAVAIDKYLGGSGDISQNFISPTEEVVFRLPDLKADRVEIKSDGKGGQTISIDTAKTECSRCLDCDVPVHIDESLCNGCGTCETVCAGDVIRMSAATNKATVKYPKDCWTCYNCELDCPTNAITVSPIIKQRPLAWKAGQLQQRSRL